MRRLAALAALVVAATSCLPSQTPVSGYRIAHVYPHDPQAFTQGLAYQDGHLYEGTGLHGRSSVRKVEIATGRVVQLTPLPGQYFGEGITLLGDRLFQLTWQERIGFVYDRTSLRLQRSFPYRLDGWGLTHDGHELISSDGSATLYRLDPNTFQETGHTPVTDRGQPVPNLNELEYVKGEILANIWQSDRIARIAPRTGKVVGWIDLNGLRAKLPPAAEIDVLNGIAYDPKGDRLFVTGKLWPRLFEIRVAPARR